MKQKQLYTAPEAEILVVRFEENFLNSYGGKNEPGSGMGESGDYTYGY